MSSTTQPFVLRKLLQISEFVEFKFNFYFGSIKQNVGISWREEIYQKNKTLNKLCHFEILQFWETEERYHFLSFFLSFLSNSLFSFFFFLFSFFSLFYCLISFSFSCCNWRLSYLSFWLSFLSCFLSFFHFHAFPLYNFCFYLFTIFFFVSSISL